MCSLGFLSRLKRLVAVKTLNQCLVNSKCFVSANKTLNPWENLIVLVCSQSQYEFHSSMFNMNTQFTLNFSLE